MSYLDHALRRAVRLVKPALIAAGALAVALFSLPSAAATGPPPTATIAFGQPDHGSPFSPLSGHDQSSNAKDNLVPRTVVIARGGSVTFAIRGFHQPTVYRPGIDDEDITVPPAARSSTTPPAGSSWVR